MCGSNNTAGLAEHMRQKKERTAHILGLPQCAACSSNTEDPGSSWVPEQPSCLPGEMIRLLPQITKQQVLTKESQEAAQTPSVSAAKR